MIVSLVMTKNPIYIHPDMSVNEVRSLMDKEKIGHLPVLDKNNKLIGLVTRKDLVKASPSAATSLDMYEISYLLSKMTIKEVMEKNVVTVAEDEVMEEAARIMADQGLGCLPVLRGSLLVGIITDTDLFHVFVNAFGARHPGIRVVFIIEEKPGQLAKICQAIAEKGGNIVSLMTSEGDDLSHKRLTLKIEGINRSETESLIRSLPGTELEDIRE
ncbi:MAG: CBS and ACT domain-containing protein [Treponema sp.]|nr:CBS and ACT domain-containing protein [Treponema sp.]